MFSRLRGGLGIATVFANAIFAAITGVSVASAAVFSKIAIPQMERLGYDRRFALGTVAGSSVLGMLIPPSVLLIIYGILAEEAIGKLFMAGVIPGILLAFVLSLGIFVMVLTRPHLGGEKPEMERLGFGTLIATFFKPWAFVALILVVLGGIYIGFFTPTEAGAIGAFGAFLLVALKGRMKLKSLWNVLLETGYTTASIFLLLITAQMYSRMLTISGLPAEVSEFVTTLPIAPIFVILLFMGIFIILGAILDSTSILLVTIPLMLPVVQSLRFDIIWFGIIAVVAVEMGLLTPPFGMVVYAMKATLASEATIEEIFTGSFPFLIMILIVLALLIFFPPLSTWLPGLM
jgi:tripartite ATP-independent transporter DctM subunit